MQRAKKWRPYFRNYRSDASRYGVVEIDDNGRSVRLRKNQKNRNPILPLSVFIFR